MSRFDLGVGLALMPGLLDELDRVADLVDCLEVEPQTFWLETGDPDRPFRLLDDGIDGLRRRFPALLAHGVTSPVGGSQPPSADMAVLYAESVRRLGVQLASEHLAFNRASAPSGAFGSAFFLPPRQTAAGVEAAVDAIAVFRADLDVPFSVETSVNYLRPRHDELDDGAFVAAVAERADCGILLDLHNLWVNERNGRQPVLEALDQLPLDRIWEVHLAGGHQRRGWWLDAHSGGLAAEVEALAAEVLPRLPEVRAVVYEIMPEFVTGEGERALRPVLERIHRLVSDAGRFPRRPASTIVSVVPAAPNGPHAVRDDRRATPGLAGPAAWEHAVASLATGRSVEGADAAVLGAELARDPGIELLRELVAAGRDGRVASGLPLTVEVLLATRDRSEVEALLARYAATCAPALWASVEATQFAAWVETELADDHLVRAALALDRAAIELARSQEPQEVELDVDPLRLIGAVRGDGDLDSVPTGRYLATVG